jgi:class 3 adenylate cyclase/tetratricopeptide (TPR) repeat protein
MTQQHTTLARHVPELAIEWQANTPEARWRSIEGTLCFADVSGFTALAERLAQKGRMGGEELVETLGSVFTTMIGIARDRGGMLLKFGGDALLLFFEGDDHPVQAASAAVEMRQALREAAKLPTSVGPLNLSMSVGLHSGDVDFFLVGSTHRELVLLGPGADQVVETENAAEAGEILVSPGTAARLPKGAVRPRSDGQPLLRWRKGHRPPDGARGLPPQSEALAAELFPGELGTYLAPGAPDPEHRVACISFIRFSGTDAVLESGGPERLAEVLDATIGPIQQVLIEEGVTLLAVDVDKDGGKLFLAAGVPYAHEDDEGVMLRAARRVADMNLPLPVQIGVNRGHVFAAEVGDTRRAAFSAMGDTTNTAARITAKAPIGKIFAHPDTLDECLTLYEVTQAEPLTLKGKAAPLVVYEVGAELGMREREGLNLDLLIGRTQELARLREVLEALADGHGGVLTLVGETGLGKTRLLREATKDLEACLQIRGEPYGANSAYRAIRDPFRALLGIERGEPQQMREQLTRAVHKSAPGLMPMLTLIGDVVDVPVEPSPEVAAIDTRFRPDRTAEVIVELLAALESRPFVFAVDEAHWCDDATAGLLARIEYECGERGWLLLAARRDVDQGFQPESDNLLPIEPMPDPDVRTLVQTLTEAAPLRPHELDAVVNRAGGYPLFAEEIIRALREAGSLDAVPESLEAAMATQVATLDRAAKRVLQYASVLGRSFSNDLLERLLTSEEQTLSDEVLERLGDYLLPEGDGRLRFRSGMLRDTVYAALAYRLRRRLHEAAAEAMEARTDDPSQVADTLAMHYSQAGDHALTWKYGRLGGERASARYAMAEAANLYELALDAARRIDDVGQDTRLQVWFALGEARMSVGLIDDSLEAYRQALKLTGQETLERAEALLNLAKARDRAGAPSSALRDLTQAEQLLARLSSSGASHLTAEIIAFRANVFFRSQRLQAALTAADNAVPFCETARARRPLATSLMIRNVARTMLEGPGSLEDLRRALEIFEEIDDLVARGTVLTNLGAAAWISGLWEEAQKSLEAARDSYLRGGNTPEAALAAYNLAEMLLSQGHVTQAERLLLDALPVVKAARWREGVCDIQRQLGHVRIEQGRFGEADAMLEDTAEEYLKIGQPGSARDTRLVQAAGQIQAGNEHAGEALLDRISQDAGDDLVMMAPKIALLRAIASARQGRFEEAATQCREGRKATRELELDYEDGLISRIWLSLPEQRFADAEREEITASAERLQDLGVETPPRSFSWSEVITPGT